MLPLKDSVRPRKYPYVNLVLLFINIAIFIFQLSLDEAGLTEFIYQYGVIPHEFILSQGQVWLPLLPPPFCTEDGSISWETCFTSGFWR